MIQRTSNIDIKNDRNFSHWFNQTYHKSTKDRYFKDTQILNKIHVFNWIFKIYIHIIWFWSDDKITFKIRICVISLFLHFISFNHYFHISIEFKENKFDYIFCIRCLSPLLYNSNTRFSIIHWLLTHKC